MVGSGRKMDGGFGGAQYGDEAKAIWNRTEDVVLPQKVCLAGCRDVVCDLRYGGLCDGDVLFDASKSSVLSPDPPWWV